MAQEPLCYSCGKNKEKSKKFYKTIGKAPWMDEVYICDECLAVLQERSKWIKNRKLEEIK